MKLLTFALATALSVFGAAAERESVEGGTTGAAVSGTRRLRQRRRAAALQAPPADRTLAHDDYAPPSPDGRTLAPPDLDRDLAVGIDDDLGPGTRRRFRDLMVGIDDDIIPGPVPVDDHFGPGGRRFRGLTVGIDDDLAPGTRRFRQLHLFDDAGRETYDDDNDNAAPVRETEAEAEARRGLMLGIDDDYEPGRGHAP